MATHDCKLLIIGGGPAGLTAAIGGGSEGLKPFLIDSGPKVGGQARQSSMIENYAGFPEGISGPELLDRFCKQASKFATNVHCPMRARALRVEGRRKIITTDEHTYAADAVLLSAGLSYTRLSAPGVMELLGKGVEYGATLDPTIAGKCNICIVGAANSAGQAAMHFSENKEATVYVLARSPIESKMSDYLVERIRATPNIKVMEDVEVAQATGTEKLDEIGLKHADGRTETIPADRLHIYIGAAPKVDWLGGIVSTDAKHFILTGHHLGEEWKAKRQPFQFETNIPGVFCSGDVRLHSVKRVAAAVGEGSAVLPSIHDYLKCSVD